MKRYSGLHDKLCTIENIEVADDNARKNKNKKYGINKHDKNRQYENEDLVDKLFNLKYKTSKYSLYKIYEPKERIIYRLPYYPDRIAHHAIMNVVKDIWTKSFIHNTYSCIEGRGIHLCANNLKRDLRKYPNETTYCLSLIHISEPTRPEPISYAVFCLRFCGGYTEMESPEWMPARSMCSIIPGMRKSSPSQMASTSHSVPIRYLSTSTGFDISTWLVMMAMYSLTSFSL